MTRQRHTAIPVAQQPNYDRAHHRFTDPEPKPVGDANFAYADMMSRMYPEQHKHIMDVLNKNTGGHYASIEDNDEELAAWLRAWPKPWDCENCHRRQPEWADVCTDCGICSRCGDEVGTSHYRAVQHDRTKHYDPTVHSAAAVQIDPHKFVREHPQSDRCRICGQYKDASPHLLYGRTAGQVTITCPYCDGEGHGDHTCPVCQGKGTITGEQVEKTAHTSAYDPQKLWIDVRVVPGGTKKDRSFHLMHGKEEVSKHSTEPAAQKAYDQAKKTSSLRVVAHDSGDGETIFHCPFCGSGDVVGGQDGTCSCGFCKKAFTVQVQPTFKNMPQTVNGQPYNIPGMPGGGPDAGAADAAVPVPPDAAPIEDAPIQDADAGAPAPQDDSGGPPQSSDKPPWMRQSQGVLVVDTGVALPTASAMRRLALRHADDPEAVLEDVRRSNRGNR